MVDIRQGVRDKTAEQPRNAKKSQAKIRKARKRKDKPREAKKTP